METFLIIAGVIIVAIFVFAILRPRRRSIESRRSGYTYSSGDSFVAGSDAQRRLPTRPGTAQPTKASFEDTKDSVAGTDSLFVEDARSGSAARSDDDAPLKLDLRLDLRDAPDFKVPEIGSMPARDAIPLPSAPPFPEAELETPAPPPPAASGAQPPQSLREPLEREFDDEFMFRERSREMDRLDRRVEELERKSRPVGLGSHEMKRDKSAPAEAEPEPVYLGASAPQSARVGDHFTARFVAYVQAARQEIEARLAKLSPRAERHLDLKRCRWQIGTPVKVRVYGKHLLISEPEDQFIWEGESSALDFDVEVSPDAPQLITTVIKFDVSIDGIVIARLRLDLEIGTQVVTERRTVNAEPVRTAFASYASKDRQRVLDRIAEIQRNGVDVFLDCLSIHPGEAWKIRLEQEIVQRELFMLFWSVNAKQSEWVTWEWQTALKHRGLRGIDPHPLDPVHLALPPQELSDLHFGDPHMMARFAYDRADGQSE